MRRSTKGAQRTLRARPAALAIAVTLVVALLGVGCGSDSDSGSASTSGGAPAAKDVRVAMVFGGPTDDGGWNLLFKQAGDAAVQAIPGTSVTYVANTFPGAQAQRAFRTLAQQGYDLVVGTAGGHDADLLKVVDDFPDTKFVAMLGRETRPNLATLDAALEQGRYLDGIVAGASSRSGKLGEIIGYPIPFLLRGVDGFTLGARSVNPKATVETLVINSWNDPGRERQAAEALVDDGADVLAMNTNTPAVPAVAEARRVGLIGYGTKRESPQWLSAFTYDWGPFVEDQVEAIQDGSWKPVAYYGTLENGTIQMLPFSPDLPDDVVAKVEEAREQLADGTLAVFTGPLRSDEGKVVVPAGESLTEPEQLVACCDWLVEGASGASVGGAGS
ncbi:MAG TPA: BMP family ABC transporter substrate-binding protein [Conexibacter sp.]|nr:BMP family ABC transporter substrate-binding protein [Conexibacter sp.]